MTIPLADEVVVHRVGGADVMNLRLKPAELRLAPPGISLFAGGSPADAVTALRRVIGPSRKWRPPLDVGTTTVAAVRAAGFEVIADPTPNFPNHAHLIHAGGAGGFTDENLARLSVAFLLTGGY